MHTPRENTQSLPHPIALDASPEYAAVYRRPQLKQHDWQTVQTPPLPNVAAQRSIPAGNDPHNTPY